MGIEEDALLRERVEGGHLLGSHRIAAQAVHYHDQDVLRGGGDGREFLGGALGAAGEDRQQKDNDEFQLLHGGNDTNYDEVVRREVSRPMKIKRKYRLYAISTEIGIGGGPDRGGLM